MQSLCFHPGCWGTRVRLDGPIFLRSDDPSELTREHGRLGYSASDCPSAGISDMDLSLSNSLQWP